jgi:uncharacterized membrane protein
MHATYLEIVTEMIKPSNVCGIIFFIRKLYLGIDFILMPLHIWEVKTAEITKNHWTDWSDVICSNIHLCVYMGTGRARLAERFSLLLLDFHKNSCGCFHCT